MSGCQNKYGGYTGSEGCNHSHSSSSVFYFISTIVAMIMLGAATVLFFCCIYYKRRRIQERLVHVRNRGQALVPAYYWPNAAEAHGLPAGPAQPPATETTADTNVSKGPVDTAAPLSCVIMADQED